MADTVRGMVADVHRELLAGDLAPQRAADLLVRLSALTSNILEEIRVADAAYALVLLMHLETEAKANRARIKAETSTEFARKQQARNTHAVAEEMLRALKYLLRGYETEMREMVRR